MAISPPSDIILDVVRAADPVREKHATARLSKIAAGDPAEFVEHMRASAKEAESASPVIQKPSNMRAQNEVSPAEKTLRGFEAMALASMIETAMPKENNEIFGTGTAGSMWRSMLAEQIGNQMAESGGIGIAKQLAASLDLFTAGDAGAPQTIDAARTMLLTPIERSFVGAAMPDADGFDDTASS